MEHTESIAVVTGGAGGIGAATCRVLVREGARVVVADVDAERARALAAELGERAIAETVDVTALDSARRLFGRVRERLGAPANVLINNAGFDVLEPFLENDPALWRKLVDVNLFGQIHCARAFLETAQGGRIVNIGSDAGRTGSGGEAVYSAAKGGVIALTKTLARESARLGVAVNCVCPGLTETALLDSFRRSPRGPKWLEAVVATIPMRRSGRPDEIAEVISFLASARASYITGQILSVNGGLTMVG
ncbi:MAG TPA: SDR family oxidoreductase [Polyangia bacterium]|nr:SDR family oxidoreductase [Polyangia bacterium]